MKSIVRWAALLAATSAFAGCSSASPPHQGEALGTQAQDLTRGSPARGRHQGRKLVGWGVDGNGEVGDGLGSGIRTSPVEIGVPEGVPEARQLAAGWGFSMLLGVDGSVWMWGLNEHGQLGDGTFKQRNVPVRVPGIDDAVCIAAGYHNSAVVRRDGSVWVWGENFYGLLGLGARDATDYPGPTQPIPNLRGVKKLAIDGFGILALKEDGTLWAWGYNSAGELGDAVPTNDLVASPVQTLPSFGPVADIAAPVVYDHTMLLRADGTLWTLGRNLEGQLGIGSEDALPHPTPTQVTAFDGVTTRAVEAATGLFHEVVRDSTGHLWSWGNPFYGTGLAQPVLVPTQVPGLDEVSSVVAGEYFTYAIRRGQPYVFGYDQVENTLTPAPFPGVTRVKLLAALDQTLALADVAPSCPSGTTYTVTNLPPLPGDIQSEPRAVNRDGFVVGYSNDGAHDHAVLWVDGVPTPLGALPGDTDSWANAINDEGEAVGISQADGTFHAVVFSGGAVTQLPTLAGATSHEVYGVNNLGDAVGDAILADGVHAVAYLGTTAVDLGFGPDGAGARAFLVNDRREAVGVSWASSGHNQATEFLPGPPVAFASLPGNPDCSALGLNQQGEASGYCANLSSSDALQAVVFRHGVATALGFLPGDTSSNTAGLNARRQAIGTSWSSTLSRAVLFEEGRVVDLEAHLAAGSTWSLGYGFAINDDGQIVGVGDPGGAPCPPSAEAECGPASHGFLLTPTCGGSR